MKAKGTFLLLISLVFCAHTAQDITLIKVLNTTSEILVGDKIGNAYLAMANGDLHKYNQKGDSITTQNFKRFGAIESMDVSNPFELYLYYKDLNKIVFLDNQLIIRGSIELEDAELENISAIARSWDNGLWVYDLSSTKLTKFTKRLEKEKEAMQSYTYTDAVLSPFQIIDRQTKIYLIDSLNGIYVFDNFGMFLNKISIKTKHPIQIVNDGLIYATDTSLQLYDLKKFNEKKLPFPITTNSTFCIANKTVLIQDGIKTSLYSLQ